MIGAVEVRSRVTGGLVISEFRLATPLAVVHLNATATAEIDTLTLDGALPVTLGRAHEDLDQLGAGVDAAGG